MAWAGCPYEAVWGWRVASALGCDVQTGGPCAMCLRLCFPFPEAGTSDTTTRHVRAVAANTRPGRPRAVLLRRAAGLQAAEA